MIISENVIISEKIRKKAAEILISIEEDKNPSRKNWYAVTTAPEPENLMYIISSSEYRHTYYRKTPLRLLGLAKTRTEAVQIAVDLVKKGYDEGKITELKEYLK